MSESIESDKHLKLIRDYSSRSPPRVLNCLITKMGCSQLRKLFYMNLTCGIAGEESLQITLRLKAYSLETENSNRGKSGNSSPALQVKLNLS